jgi:hypothetical protein
MTSRLPTHRSKSDVEVKLDLEGPDADGDHGSDRHEADESYYDRKEMFYFELIIFSNGRVRNRKRY